MKKLAMLVFLLVLALSIGACTVDRNVFCGFVGFDGEDHLGINVSGDFIRYELADEADIPTLGAISTAIKNGDCGAKAQEALEELVRG